MSAPRRFFSGNSVEQALAQAAAHYGCTADRLAWKEVDKRHGFLKVRRKAVIEIDPQSPYRDAGGAAEAPGEPGPPPGRTAAPPEAPRAPDRQAASAAAPPTGRAADIEPRPTVPAPPDRQTASAAAPPTGRAADIEPRPTVPAPPEGAVGDPRASVEPPPPGRAEEVAPREDGPREEAGRTHAEEEESAPPREPREGGRRRGRRGRGRGRRGAGEGGSEFVQLPDSLRKTSERYERASGEMAAAVLSATRDLLELAGLELEVEVFDAGEELLVELAGPDEDPLLADRGRAMFAIQHLVPRLLHGMVGRSTRVTVDCDNFQEVRTEMLRDEAQKAAGEVQRTGRSTELEPMAPDERRLVHLALADDPTVTTQSSGEGYFKRVRVLPAGGERRDGRPRDRRRGR